MLSAVVGSPLAQFLFLLLGENLHAAVVGLLFHFLDLLFLFLPSEFLIGDDGLDFLEGVLVHGAELFDLLLGEFEYLPEFTPVLVFLVAILVWSGVGAAEFN